MKEKAWEGLRVAKKNDWLWDQSVEWVKRHNRILKIWKWMIVVFAVAGLILCVFAQEDAVFYVGVALLGCALVDLPLYWIIKYRFEYLDLTLSMNYIIADYCRKNAKHPAPTFDPHDEYDEDCD